MGMLFGGWSRETQEEIDQYFKGNVNEYVNSKVTYWRERAFGAEKRNGEILRKLAQFYNSLLESSKSESKEGEEAEYWAKKFVDLKIF